MYLKAEEGKNVPLYRHCLRIRGRRDILFARGAALVEMTKDILAPSNFRHPSYPLSFILYQKQFDKIIDQ